MVLKENTTQLSKMFPDSNLVKRAKPRDVDNKLFQ